MNITVRVMTKQAQAALLSMERQLTTTSRIAGASSFGAGAAGTATKSFKTLGNSMQWAGYQLMHAFTIPLLAAGGAAMKYELDNEKAFAGVKKVYGDSALAAQDHGRTITNELSALRKEFVALSDVYGVSQTKVLQIAESWAAAGVSGSALGTAVENTMKTMVIGDLNAADATKALIAIQAQYGASTVEMTDILNALNVVENQTGASMGDLITGFGNAASVAAQAGVDYRHLAAMIAALVPAQGSAAKAGNALKSIFTNLLVPTKRGAEALKEMGINVDDTAWRSKTATERLELLSVKFRKLDGNQKVAASNYIAGKYQISRFAQSMADLSKSFDANGKLITGNYQALGSYGRALASTNDKTKNAKIAQQELNTVLESNPQKLKQVWTILKNDAASSVTRLIPFLIQFVTIIAGLVHAFSNLNPVIQRWVAILILTLALLGPILLYVAAITKLIAVMGTVFRTAGKGVMWFIGLFTGAGKEVRVLEKRIAELQTELARMSAMSPVEKLQAEIAALEGQIEALLVGTRATTLGMTESFGAAAAVISGDAAEIALAYQGTLLDLDTAFVATAGAGSRAFGTLAIEAGVAAGDVSLFWVSSLAEMQVATAAWAAENLAAVSGVETIYIASAAGIEVAYVALADSMATLEYAKALAATRAAAIAAAAWARAYSTVTKAGEAAMAAAVAAEEAKILAMLEVLGVMAKTMGSRILLTETWTSSGLLEIASIDAVSAALIVQMRILHALQVQAMATSARMIEANTATAASASGAIVPVKRSVGTVASTAGTGAVVAGAGLKNGSKAAEDGMRAANGKLYAETRSAAAKTEGVWARSMSKIGGIFRGGFSAIARLVNIFTFGLSGAIGSAISGAATAVAGAVGVTVGVFAAIVLAVIAVFLVFRHQFTALGKAILDGIIWLAKGIWDGLKAIGGFFADLTSWVIDSLVALPKAVFQIMQAVVDVIAKAAHQVYDFFSYLNPFAHHSPSLVENVDKGMDRVARKFAGVRGSISGSMKGAYADIKTFGQAIAGLIKTDADAQKASDIKLLSKYAPGAIASYKALSGDLDVLNGQYKQLGNAMTAQQAIVDAQKFAVDNLNDSLTVQTDALDKLKDAQTRAGDALDASKQKMTDFADAPIAGMKAMRDEIFANDMAQKQLQLQMDLFSDSVGGIDDVQKKMSDLAGEIERLKGEQADLRGGGAGSDILSAYDDQIKALEGQQGGIQATVNSYAQMQTALDKLNKQGDELSLQQSLQFDPLTKQIQDLVDTTKELPFDTIVAGIQSTQSEITKNTQAYDKATVAVDKQQAAVDRLTVARDAQQKILDAEQKKLDLISDAYNKVGDAIQAASSAMSDMTSAANSLASAQSKTKTPKADDLLGSKAGLKDASGPATIGRVGGLGDQSAKIDADTKKQLDKLKGTFDKMDLFGGLKDKFNAIGRWIKKWIWDEPAKWGDWIVKQTSRLAGMVWGWLGDGVSAIGGALATGWNAVMSFFSGLGSKLLSLITGAPGWLVSVGKDILIGLLNGLWAGIVFIGNFFLNLPGYILKLIVNLPGMLLDVGKAIIYGLGYGLGFAVGMIWKFFTQLLPNILGFLGNVGIWLLHIGWDILGGLLRGIVAGLGLLASFFAHLPIWIGKFFVAALTWLIGFGADVLSGLYHGIIDGAKAIGRFFMNLPGWIGSFLVTAGSWLLDTGISIIRGIGNGIVNGASAVWNWFKNLPGNLLKLLAGAPGWLKDVGMNILKGLWNGFTGFIGMIWNGIKSFIGGFIDGFKKALGINSPSTVFMQFGQNIMEGLWNGIKAVFSFIISFFVGLAGKIIAGVGNLASTLYHAGIDLLTGLWNGIVYIWNSVVSFFTNFVPNILIKIGRMERSLYQKGLDFLNGLWNGIKYVWNTVLSFFGNLAITIVNKIGNVARSIYNKGKDFLSGLFTGITDGAVAVWDFFTNLPKKIGSIFAKAATWLYDAGKSIASGLYDGVKKGLEFLAKIFGTPVYWAVHYAINPIIKGINYLPGVDISTIPEKNIPHFAKGGIIPGKHNRDDVQIYATPGEVVVPKNIVNAMGGAQSLMDAMGFGRGSSASPGHYATGGEVPAQTAGRYGPTGGYDDPRASQSARNRDRILSDLAAQGGTILGKFVDKVTHLIRKGAANAFMATVGKPLKYADNALDSMKGGFGVTLNKAIDTKVDEVYNWILGKEKVDVKKAAKATGPAAYERIIISQADSMGLGRKGAEIGLMTALVESNMKNYANANIPESLKIPHDAVGSDHYSAGLFQQQTGPFGNYWGTVAQVMDPNYSAHRFYAEMKKKVPGWASMDSGSVAQAVQVSAFPAAYRGRQGEADKILNSIVGAPTTGRGGKNVGMDAGGLLPTGLTQIFNDTGRPEVVAPAKTFDDLFGGMTANLKSASAAFTKLDTQASSSPAEPTVVNNHTEVHFHGDLSFPNVTDKSDASDFLSNLESMVK